MSEVDAARARIAAGEAEVAAGRSELAAALAAACDDERLSARQVAEKYGMAYATVSNAIAAHRKLHPKPVDSRPALRGREKGGRVPAMQFEEHPTQRGFFRPILTGAAEPTKPPEVTRRAREPEGPPDLPPEPNSDPNEVDF